MASKKYTMIGQGQARIGFRFVFKGSADKCVKCERYKSCSEPLEAGRVYEVRDVRRKRFICNLHGPDAKLVVVGEADYEANIESRSAVLNALIEYDPIECDLPCNQQNKCFPTGLSKSERCLIVGVGPMIRCPRGKRISSVLLRREAGSVQTSPRKGRI